MLMILGYCLLQNGKVIQIIYYINILTSPHHCLQIKYLVLLIHEFYEKIIVD